MSYMEEKRPTTRRRQKYSRSRTGIWTCSTILNAGCLTCRRRRIKCDEQRPICAHCRPNSRECIYPSHLSSPSTSRAFSDKTSKSPEESFQLPDDDHNVGENEETADTMITDQTMVIGPRYVAPCGDDFDLDLTPETSQHIPFTEPSINGFPQAFFSFGLSSFDISAGEYAPPGSLHYSILSPIPRPPDPNQPPAVRFFLKYHQDEVVAGHYFFAYDQEQLCRNENEGLCKVWLPRMAQNSVSIRDAMVAFSALIYSLKVDSKALQFAFLYYSMALDKLRHFLTYIPYDSSEVAAAIATSLQMAALDRFFGHTRKCLRHLEGVARILQKYSDPIQQASTVLGRALLEWYCHLEDYICMLSGSQNPLPSVWRERNLQMRRELAMIEYPQLTGEVRYSRILRDMWPELWIITPQLPTIVAKVSALNNLEGEQKEIEVAQVESQITNFLVDLEALKESPYFLEITQRVDRMTPPLSHHLTCCPPFPFTPIIIVCPAAANLHMQILAMQIYINKILIPNLHGYKPNIDDLAKEIASLYAGMEYSFSQDSLFPTFSGLTMSGFSEKKELRMWLWCKLKHFEELGKHTFGPIKKHLAVFWKIPKLLQEGFSGGWKEAGLKEVSSEELEMLTSQEKRGSDEEKDEEVL